MKAKGKNGREREKEKKDTHTVDRGRRGRVGEKQEVKGRRPRRFWGWVSKNQRQRLLHR